MIDLWNFENYNLNLYNDLTKIDDSIPSIFNQIFIEIKTNNPSVFDFWDEEDLLQKVHVYLFRYVLPQYELVKFEKKTIEINDLIIQLLSCVVWRTFDNSIDNHVSSIKGPKASLIALVHLFQFSNRNFQYTNYSKFESHFEIMTEQSILERISPIEFNNIWKRCSIMVFALEDFSKLNNKSIELFKDYINYSGLAHDTHDYFNDVKNEVISLPVYWMKELNPDHVLNINFVKLLYEKVRIEISTLEQKFAENSLETYFPIINYFIKDSRKTFYDE